MNISAGQIWDNLFYFFMMAIVLELAISAVLSIKFIDELLNNSLLKTVKNALVLIVAFSLCAKVESLRIFHGAKPAMPDLVHFVISSLALARLANLVHDMISYIQRRAKQQ